MMQKGCKSLKKFDPNFCPAETLPFHFSPSESPIPDPDGNGTFPLGSIIDDPIMPTKKTKKLRQKEWYKMMRKEGRQEKQERVRLLEIVKIFLSFRRKRKLD
jgi:hypothetical protein